VVLPQTANLLSFDRSQQPSLNGEAHFADLVEEQGPFARGFDQPRPIAIGACVGALGVPEQLGVEDVRRQCGAIDRDERSFPSRLRVREVGEELFAGAGFAKNQDR
jgi:hypothetical protein